MVRSGSLSGSLVSIGSLMANTNHESVCTVYTFM